MRSGSVLVRRSTIITALIIGIIAAVSLPGAIALKGKGSCKRRGTCDTTAPSVAFSGPAAGSTVSGTITVSGTASDNIGLSNVEVSVDGGAFLAATGTSSWTRTVDTTGLANGSHTLTARATDTSGNAKSVSETVTTSNSAPAPTASPTPTPTASSSPTPTPTPTQSTTNTSSHMVTPEGVTIDINSAGSWTTDQIYAMLKASALELSTIGPHLKIKVQDTYSSQCVTSASTSGGVFTSFNATIYLKGVDSAFSVAPDAGIAHEYGHAWTFYHLYMTHQGDWSSYINTRWANGNGGVLSSDARLDSSYVWMASEIIADDYRLLFGSTLAKSQRPTHMNPDIPEPTDQPGLSNWFLNTWA